MNSPCTFLESMFSKKCTSKKEGLSDKHSIGQTFFLYDNTVAIIKKQGDCNEIDSGPGKSREAI